MPKKGCRESKFVHFIHSLNIYWSFIEDTKTNKVSMALKISPSGGRERKKTLQGDESSQRVSASTPGVHSRSSEGTWGGVGAKGVFLEKDFKKRATELRPHLLQVSALHWWSPLGPSAPRAALIPNPHPPYHFTLLFFLRRAYDHPW